MLIVNCEFIVLFQVYRHYIHLLLPLLLSYSVNMYCIRYEYIFHVICLRIHYVTYTTITTYNKRITYKIEKIKNETRIKESIPCFRSISIFSFLCIIKMIESKIIKMIANIPNKFLCNIQLNKIVSAII